MDLSGPGSFYQQRMHSSGSQTSLNTSPIVNQLPSPPFQSNIGVNTFGTALPIQTSVANLPHGVNVGATSMIPMQNEPQNKKRGRPRKYRPEGAVSLGLSPSFAAANPGTKTLSPKRGRGRPPSRSYEKGQLPSPGKRITDTAGVGFTPHVIPIEDGEDIVMKISSFSHQGQRAISILSANGSVSSVTLQQPSTATTVTFEGDFEILSLSGSIFLADYSASQCQVGGLHVSLANPDGHVFGGRVGGKIIASRPFQVILGSFILAGSKTMVKGSDHKTIENPTPSASAIPLSQNLSSTFSMGLQHDAGSLQTHDATLTLN